MTQQETSTPPFRSQITPSGNKGSLVVDATKAPLVRATLEGEVSDDAYRAHLTELNRFLDAEQPFGIVFDALRAEPTSPRQRKLMADWMRTHAARLRKTCVGFAVVINSAVVRGAFTAFLWLSPLPCKFAVVGTVAEAERWVEERLRAGNA